MYLYGDRIGGRILMITRLIKRNNNVAFGGDFQRFTREKCVVRQYAAVNCQSGGGMCVDRQVLKPTVTIFPQHLNRSYNYALFLWNLTVFVTSDQYGHNEKTPQSTGMH
ncbi:hypothetical protein LBMAG53_14970 [Planctomycetota bacterium]|nr:hypothetical protein LBMAG53_14970 [Planctomycetota bacterium]